MKNFRNTSHKHKIYFSLVADTKNFHVLANYSFYRSLMEDLNASIGIRSQRHRIGLGLAFPLQSPK